VRAVPVGAEVPVKIILTVGADVVIVAIAFL
jgi:hypothetical protein